MLRGGDHTPHPVRAHRWLAGYLLVAGCAFSLACATPTQPSRPSEPGTRPTSTSTDPEAKGGGGLVPARSDPVAEGEAADGSETDVGDVSEDPGTPGGSVERGEGDSDDVRNASWGLARRAESALESMLIGTVLGGQVGGGYGAAVGATVLGIYGLVTGDVPFDSGSDRPRRPGTTGDVDEALEREIEAEIERQGALEAEIEAELRRQEELLEEIAVQEQLNEQIAKEQRRRVALEQADPLSSPPVPYVREIPDSVFDTQERVVGGDAKVVKSLDADRDGRPEMEKVYDDRSGRLESVAQDTNYDGRMDSQLEYGAEGEIVATLEDADHDGTPDRFVQFENGRGARVEVDRNNDGVRDAFQVYAGDALAYEEYDDDNDGRVNRRVEYRDRARSVEMEDRDADGTMDLWTYYAPDGRPIRVERDTRRQDGKPDVFEHYEGRGPDMRIVRKEEDVNGDGKVDVVSHYEDGRLSRKEIQDPDALE